MKRYSILGILAAVFLLLAAAVPDTSPEGVCRSFLEARGWRTGDFTEEPLQLPEAGDAAWNTYLVLQEENGFDLAACGGKTVLHLSCPILNHPDGENVYANLYWYEGHIVGGDIMSPALDGFMQGLEFSSF